ncbi:trehalose-phosphatase [Aeromicrobium choanae]|uniref:Trehalose 6-phosphate phosphatase n=1 Tax=Aeromicrobium choanae TaxID=1736691 RepID=A0A1T4Z2L3_9ACTN|nr:trehalose-phosphatase [Aeromicrobium choanae]SKB08068.1 trehalose 6-phosphatase [Aeromicrobium choanae]
MTEPGGTLLALDFDGTLAPIVDDPASAWIHPDSLAALRRLGPVLRELTIITGRPVEQVRRLGRFEDGPGLDRMVVCGQYGAERWDAASGEVRRPHRPQAVSDLAARLPQWLVEHDASRIRIEDKGLAIALHTRGVAPGLLDELRPQIEALAAEVGLHLEPGRQVIELRSAGTDKGQTLRRVVGRVEPGAVIYAGDDLGDLPAFEEGIALREQGMDVTLVCSASDEQDALVALADVVLDGPDAVAAWLGDLADRFAPA